MNFCVIGYGRWGKNLHNTLINLVGKEKVFVYDSDFNDIDNYKNLNVDEVKMLDCPPMYEVGGHTVNHEILSYLTKDKLDYEVSECIQTLESIVNRKIDLFSYPEGQENHYNQKVIDCLKRNNVTICPSAIDGFLDDEDEFNYRRIMVGFQDNKFPFKEYYND